MEEEPLQRREQRQPVRAHANVLRHHEHLVEKRIDRGAKRCETRERS